MIIISSYLGIVCFSPIMEGSSEDSGAHSKSSNLHHTTMESHHLPMKVHLTPVLDQSEDTRSLLQDIDDQNLSTHVIDMSAYVEPELDEKTEQLMSMSVCIVDPKDPFDHQDRERMLAHLKTPLNHYDTYNQLDEHMPNIKKGNILSLGKVIPYNYPVYIVLVLCFILHSNFVSL